MPDWGSFCILDVDYSRLAGQVLHVEDTMKGFVKDLEILFGGDETEASSERIVQNIIAATDSLFSLSKLVQRVRVSYLFTEWTSGVPNNLLASKNASHFEPWLKAKIG